VTFVSTGRAQLSSIAHNRGLAIRETKMVNMIILRHELRNEGEVGGSVKWIRSADTT
jgi:hypothetical protein